MVQNGPKWSIIFPNLSKRVQKGPKASNMVQYGKYGPNLSKKSSKWIRHNQVSWSSFYTTEFLIVPQSHLRWYCSDLLVVLQWSFWTHFQLSFTGGPLMIQDYYNCHSDTILPCKAHVCHSFHTGHRGCLVFLLCTGGEVTSALPSKHIAAPCRPLFQETQI